MVVEVIKSLLNQCIGIMNKKLRLLLTLKCPNKCPLCCNNGRDFEKLPVVDRWDYDEIMLTGGEPLMFPRSTEAIIRTIQNIQILQGIENSKMYVYTAIADRKVFLPVLDKVDGIVLTPHKKSDIKQFLDLNKVLLANPEMTKDKSLRLNLFEDMKKLIPQKTNLSLWQVKDIEWIKDCPVPQGEDFRRIAHFTEE